MLFVELTTGETYEGEDYQTAVNKLLANLGFQLELVR
jgi:hypothetical protein